MILDQECGSAPALVVTHSGVALHAFSRLWGGFPREVGPTTPRIRTRHGPDPSRANQTPATNQQAVRADLRLSQKQTRPPDLGYVANNHTTTFALWGYSIKRNDANVMIDLGPRY
ncbi:hypothetical protein N7530_007865 [Penicillium desertorum]|uniref:Uncharacterized protein n=1 Tax=Penicillium desertorum TaxID=1303715 RepID=A0A9W9WNM9_9EURO|nr:hypothetical protein N7530_007865 [Penicillium desertorum]